MRDTVSTLRQDNSRRIALIEELSHRYADTNRFSSLRHRFRFWRKKYAWIGIVGGAQALKRMIDIVGASTLLLCSSPFLILVAVLIKLTDRGPVLYWQTRVGRWGREFPFPKFRSMVTNAERIKAELANQNDHENSITFKMKKDPRVTWIGRIIRKLSIDELPQLWNVIIGDMSLVGPRPPLPSEVSQYSLLDRRRLDVVPGLTCFWQISGRGDIPFPKQVELDVQYIESQSVWLDLKILLQTIPAVLLGKGAY